MSAQHARAAFDQVVRRQEFTKAHPDVHIEHQTAPLWHWLASWREADGAEHHIVDHELGGLLDQLDRHFPA